MAKAFEIAFQIRRTMYEKASMAEMEEKMGFSSDELEEFLKMREKPEPRQISVVGGWKYCPTCGTPFDDPYVYQAKYCLDCGQALDWRGVDERSD